MDSLMHLKDSLPSLVHSNLVSFFNNFCKGFMYSAKFGINLLMKLMCPLKDWRDLTFLGKGIFLISSILSGSTFTPYLEMIFPRIFPSSIPKNRLCRTKRNTIFPTYFKDLLKMAYVT